MIDAPSGEARRYPDTAVSVPIVYGSCAFFLGKKAHETATHKWTLFVRGPNDEDLSVFIIWILSNSSVSAFGPITASSPCR